MAAPLRDLDRVPILVKIIRAVADDTDPKFVPGEYTSAALAAEFPTALTGRQITRCFDECEHEILKALPPGIRARVKWVHGESKPGRSKQPGHLIVTAFPETLHPKGSQK